MKTLLRPIGALLLCAAPAWATTLIALDLTALSRSADAIVQGRVSRVEPRLSKDGRISTTITLDVSESLKGDAPAAVEVVQPGGVVGDLGQRVAGTVHLRPGDEIVGFLERRGPRFMFVGMAQGCFRVERSSDGAAAFAVPDREGDALLLDPVTRQPVQRGTEPMKLELFKGRVRAALAPPGVADQPPPGPAIERKAVK